MPSDQCPSYRRRRIGDVLRRLREDRGMTQAAASRLLDRSAPSISAIELGHYSIRQRDLLFILDQYGNAAPDQREHLLALASQGRQRGWWHTFEQRLDPTVLDFASLESDAVAVRSLELNVIPGLLQTEDYARAVIMGSGGRLRPSRDIETGVEFRLARQRILDAEPPLELTFIVGEAALRQRIGGSGVMRDQLARLLTVSRLPHVSLRVLPYAAGAHPGVDGPFVILDVGAAVLLRAVVIHSLTRSWYVDEEPDVTHYVDAYDRFGEITLSEAASRAHIERISSEL